MASLKGDGVFPLASDWAETAEWAECVERAPGDGVRANITYRSFMFKGVGEREGRREREGGGCGECIRLFD